MTFDAVTFDPMPMAAYYEQEMASRAERPLTPERRDLVQAFADRLHRRNITALLEVGCGAGRDGRTLASAVPLYAGVDTAIAGVAHCRAVGLDGALMASATALPFGNNSFEARLVDEYVDASAGQAVSRRCQRTTPSLPTRRRGDHRAMGRGV